MIKKRILCNLAFVIIIFIYVSHIMGWKEDRKSSYFQSMKYFKEHEVLPVKGTVIKKELKADQQILYLKNNSIISQNHLFKFSKIMVEDKDIMPVKIGQTLSFKGTMTFFKVAKNPGNFDPVRYYTSEKIEAYIKLNKVEKIEGEEDRLQEGLYKLRSNFSNKIQEICGVKNGSILSGILLGEKGNLDKDTKELYRSVGIGHLLAVSGLHLSIIGEGLYQLLRKKSGSFLGSGLVGSIFLLLYILMIGVTLSVIRAFVMYLFRIGADIFGRKYDARTALMSAALLLLIYNQDYLYQGGFYLSLGAVLGFSIIKENKLKSIGLNLVLLGPLAFFFYEIPTYSFLLNLLVIPLLSVLFMLGLLGGLGFLICPMMGTLCFSICNAIVNFYNIISEWNLSLPLARMVLGRPSFLKLGGYYLLLLLFLFLLKKQQVKTIKKGIFLLAFWAFGIFIFTIKAPRRGAEITMLDVGQGDCLLIQTVDNKNYLVDGGSSSIKEVGRQRIESYLKYKGIKNIDMAFISHGDFDHYGGIKELLDRSDYNGIKIKSLMVQRKEVQNEAILELVEEAKAKNITIIEGKTGSFIQDKEGKITVIQSPHIASTSNNNDSLILVYEFKGCQILLTGDIEEEAEKELLEMLKKSQEEFAILKVAHHGSNTSTSKELLKEIKPRIALISAGVNNSYGHPHEETLNHLKEAGTLVYDTASKGAISILINEERNLILKEYVREIDEKFK